MTAENRGLDVQGYVLETKINFSCKNNFEGHILQTL